MVQGLLLGQHLDPASVPVLTHRGWLLLDNEGLYTQIPSEQVCGCGTVLTSERKWSEHTASGCGLAGRPGGGRP